MPSLSETDLNRRCCRAVPTYATAMVMDPAFMY